MITKLRLESLTKSPVFVTITFLIIVLASAQIYQHTDHLHHQRDQRDWRSTRIPPLFTLLLKTPTRSLSTVPIARMNFLCATGLREEIHLSRDESTLQTWAQRIKSETDRHFYHFRQHPEQFENSEGFYRMLMMSVVLAEDFKIHYADDKKSDPRSKPTADISPSPGGEGRGEGRLFLSPRDNFFSEPNYVFLTGLLGPERKGTCSSMPVLYVAIGRELGYPLKLVTTKGHLFVRWDAPGERFNIEATTRGLSRFDDEYYRHWPFEITPAEEQAEGYLKSLTPSEELAVFMSIRGMCLRQAKRYSEAAEAFAAAAHLAPNCASYQKLANFTKNQIVSKTQPRKSKGQKL